MLEMLLMLLVMCVLTVISLAVSWKMLNSENPVQDAVPKAKARPAVPDTRFFLEAAPVGGAALPRVPIEAMLLQIEHHIRLEHAAAQSFLDCPTAQSLHQRTPSPLIVH